MNTRETIHLARLENMLETIRLLVQSDVGKDALPWVEKAQQLAASMREEA